MKRAFFWVAAALTVVFAVWAVLSWRTGPVAFDDAYISFRYAKNLLAGHGLVYNPGERVEGYTNFAWTMIAALGMALGADPLAFTRVIGVGAYAGCLVLSGLAVTRGAAGRFAGLAGFLPLVVLVAARGYPPFAGTGLETPFVSFLTLSFGVLHHLYPAQTTRGWMWRGVVPALLLMTRLDAAPFVVGSVVATAFELWKRGPRALPRELSRRYGVAAALVIAWFGFKLAYYGDLLPNTYYAKAAGSAPLEAGIAYVRAFVESYPAVLLMLPLALLGALAPPPPVRHFARFAAVGLLLYLAYMVKVGGDFMHYRFAFQVLPVLVVLAALGVVTLSRTSVAAAIATGALIALLAPGQPKLETKFYMQSIAEMNDYYELGTKVGKALDAALPPGTVLSTGMAGAIAYYTDFVNVDELGLCDAYISRLPAAPGPRGHIKHAPREYLMARGVNLVLMHPMLCSCDRPCPAPGVGTPRDSRPPPHVFVRVEGDQCLRAEYLVRTPELTRYFCDQPERFVVTGMPCPR